LKLTIEASGIETIQHELKGIVDDKKINRLLEQARILIEGEAKHRCPIKTGYLRDNITHRRISNLTWEIAATADYADYVEFGTMYMKAGTPESPYVYTSPVSGHYPSYRPFLRSALYSNMNRIMRFFDKHMTDKPVSGEQI